MEREAIRAAMMKLLLLAFTGFLLAGCAVGAPAELPGQGGALVAAVEGAEVATPEPDRREESAGEPAMASKSVALPEDPPLAVVAPPLLAQPVPAEEALPDAPLPVPPAPADEPPLAEPTPAAPPRTEPLPAEEPPCDPNQPRQLPGRGQGGPSGWGGFRDPLPRTPLWNPDGPKRVGLQAGHWRVEEAPAELRGLQHGTSGGGKHEWEVNLDIAERAARLLQAAGIEVDILPAIVPIGYRAHAFVSIHADGDAQGVMRGYKIARPGFSSIPEVDDVLVEELYAAYGAATQLPRDDLHITRRMTYYYAFNSRRYCHAVAPGVPQVIVETGFLTSPVDRQLLIGNPDAAARGIANGVLAFLTRLEAET